MLLPTLMAISMAVAMRRYYTPHITPDGEGLWLSQKPLNTTIGRVLALIASIGHVNTSCFFNFIVKRAQVDMLAPNNNRGVTYQNDKKHLNNMS